MKKKSMVVMGVMFGLLAFFASPTVHADPQSDAQAEVQKQIDGIDKSTEAGQQAVDEITKDHKTDTGNKDGSQVDVGGIDRSVGRDPDQISAEMIKQKLAVNDMNWVNQNILQNYQMYYVMGSPTDFSNNMAHMLADFFQNINTNIVYSMTDTGLSHLYDLSGISSSMNQVLGQVATFNRNMWSNRAFQGLACLALAVGAVTAFVKMAKDYIRLGLVLLMVVIGTVWVSVGGTFLTTLNSYTTSVQAEVFQATANTDQAEVQDTGANFSNAVRHNYFTKTVERPFYLGNFGVTSADKVNNADGDPYLLLGSKSQNKVKKNFSNQQYIKAGSSNAWFQTTLAFMSPAVSVAYAVPYLAIGIGNMLLQLGAIAVYFIAPFVALLAFIPRYAHLLTKTMAMAVGLLLGKIGLLFGIVFVNWTGNLVDVIIPPVNSGAVFLNAFVFIFLMVVLWKKKSSLVNLIAGGSEAGQMTDRFSLSLPVKSGSHLLSGAVSSYLGNRFANRNRDSENEEEEEKKQEEMERRNERMDAFLDEQEIRRHQEKQQAKRERRLADDEGLHQPFSDRSSVPNGYHQSGERERKEGITNDGQAGHRQFDTHGVEKPVVYRREELLRQKPTKEDIDLEKDLKTVTHESKSGVPE
ncbi:CD3337/EF1877 family mobilome membrane protein [Fructobacillus cardui]|uniref:CD3337/EF1877 family mobilome membrane protein n=1 Tax=Fructobacillus cardui TaxID=2893170 RepID=UPI002D96ABAF|nr:COG5644 [Fructobacillus cardui]